MKIDWRRLSFVVIGAAGVGFALYFVFRFAARLFLPFFLAFLFALVTRPLVLFLARHSRMPEKAIAAILTALLLLLFGYLLYLLALRLVSETQNLLRALIADSEDPTGEIAGIGAFLTNLKGRFPLLSRLGEASVVRDIFGDPSLFFAEEWKETLREISHAMTQRLSAFLGGLPSFLFALAVGVIAAFFISMDFSGVCRTLASLLPTRWQENLPRQRARAGALVKRYLRAYFLIFLLTFGELLLGFSLLRVRYVFLLALFTALLDIMPVLGVGTVLVPYAIFSFLRGHIALGSGLLIVYGVITIVRQIVEPHLVGRSIGTHPLLLLVTFYVSVRLFGFAGVFAGPVAAVALKALWRRCRKQEENKESAC